MTKANRLGQADRRLYASLACLFGAFWAGSVSAAGAPLLDCLVKPNRVVDLASSVPGVVSELHAERGELLAAGAVAARLESSVEEATVVLAKARAAIDSEVQANSVNLAYDERRRERINALYDKQSVSIELRDEAERGKRLSKWRLQQARDLKQVRALELARAEQQLAQKTVRSPIEGYVLKHFRQVGEYVEDQPILRVAQLDPLAVEAVVPLEMRGFISQGMSALVHPQTPGAQPVEATVTTVDPVADAATGTFGVRLTLPNPNNEILSGVKCAVSFGGMTQGSGLVQR